MSTELARRTVSVAPINLNPDEETVIRNTFESLRPHSDREYSYSLMENESIKDAEILIANLETADFSRTNQLLKRVYGVKSTIFVSEDESFKDNAEYKYIVSRDKLSDTILKVLDTVSSEQLRIEHAKSAGAQHSQVPEAGHLEIQGLDRQRAIGKILVVDDSPSVRTQMNLYLTKHNFDCYMAENSEEAIRAVKQIQLDLIFLDVVMPGADGYQACKAIKSLLGDRQTPVILLTSKSSPVDKIHGIMSGCDKYITKPVRSSELKSLLSSYFPNFKYKKVADS